MMRSKAPPTAEHKYLKQTWLQQSIGFKSGRPLGLQSFYLSILTVLNLIPSAGINPLYKRNDPSPRASSFIYFNNTADVETKNKKNNAKR